MVTLTLEQVKVSGLPATRLNAGRRECFTVDYLPGNPSQERFRVSGGPYGCTSFGPGGDGTPQDGWQHADGCGCEYCGDGGDER